MKTLIVKDKIRRKLVKKYEFKRKLLKLKYHSEYLLLHYQKNIDNIKYYDLIFFDLQFRLARMSRNFSITRIQNRCLFTGRSKSVYKQFKISRMILKELMATKFINGLMKSSW